MKLHFVTSREVVSRRGGQFDEYPIHCLWNTLKSLPFTANVARLGIEFGSFENEERGGLLSNTRSGRNALFYMMGSHNRGEETNQLFDHAYLTQLIRMRHMGIIKKEDIHHHNRNILACINMNRSKPNTVISKL